jgi:uncharacterized protein
MDQLAHDTTLFSNDITFVLIVSKFCNLRCRYCYEYPDLGDRRRMSSTELGRIFAAVADHFGSESVSIRFAWQGGEPLIHEPAYFREALSLQEDVFRSRPQRVVNVLQTNLTVLDDERIALLKDRFDGVGVSHDVVGDLRVDARGRTRTAKTVANLSKLIEAGVRLAGISVLSRKNAAQIADIYAFWRNRGLPFRLLPVHSGPFADAESFALTPEQVCRAYCECFELWLADEGAPADVAPLGELLSGVLRRHAGLSRVSPYHERKRFRESVLIIGTDGCVGGANELLDLQHAYGNVFESSLSQLLASDGHQRSVMRAESAIQRACADCPFFGSACSGAPIAESEKDFRTFGTSPRARCPIARRVLAYMERRLTECGFIDSVTGALTTSGNS